MAAAVEKVVELSEVWWRKFTVFMVFRKWIFGSFRFGSAYLIQKSVFFMFVFLLSAVLDYLHMFPRTLHGFDPAQPLRRSPFCFAWQPLETKSNQIFGMQNTENTVFRNALFSEKHSRKSFRNSECKTPLIIIMTCTSTSNSCLKKRLVRLRRYLGIVCCSLNGSSRFSCRLEFSLD